MMDCTDRHDRYFLRLISKNVMLYTEMVVTKAVLRGDKDKLLKFNNFEKPLALQVGGSDKKELSEVTKIAEDYGYDEVNINLGCPSKKVQKNSFGACLMKEPDLVAECLAEMQNISKIPITAKTRIGFDNTEEFDYLNMFVNKMKNSGCKTIILHARKAILKGLTPKQNLNIPKLNYQMVYDIKKSNPELEIIINGGITSTKEIKNHLINCDGVMIGRAIYQNPYLLRDIENEIFKNYDVASREKVVQQILKYLEEELKNGTKVNQVMRHTVGLYHGQQGSKEWKKYLSDNMMARDSDFKKAKHIMDIAQNNEKGKPDKCLMENIDTNVIINLITVLSIAAAVAGFMAGLLGVGGGIIMVPALYYAFSILEFDIVTRMHLSVGTSLAIIIPTSIISTKTHMEYDAVDFKMVKTFGVLIVLGVLAGTFLAVNLKTPALVLFFACFSFCVGLFFIFFRDKLLDHPKEISKVIKNISGLLIGFISVPLGIGGGSLMVPFLRTFGYDIRTSIGTAAAVGFLIAVTGTTTMVVGGNIIDNVKSPFSFGYINLLGFIVFVPITMIMARIGAKVVYKINKKLLSRIFGCFLLLVSARSFFEYFNLT